MRWTPFIWRISWCLATLLLASLTSGWTHIALRFCGSRGGGFAAGLLRGHSDSKDQIRRPASSVVRNIAEGANRWHVADKAARFIVAHGECGGCDATLTMASRVGLLSEPNFRELALLADRVAPVLMALIRKGQSRASP